MLLPRLPRGLELDVPSGTNDGVGVVSLVAFDFLDTRVRGVKWPRHVNFPEINLRFYVQLPGTAPEPARRGVMFIREYVPRGLISFVARTLYNEPYAAARMRSSVSRAGDTLTVSHEITPPGGRASRISVTAAATPSTPPAASRDHWFKEHEWGFGRSRDGDMLVYSVKHPVWATHAVESFDLDFDWSGLYGTEWGFLAKERPVSVVLAEGSPVEVHPKRILKGPAVPPAINAPEGYA
jgi:uncharacterized protein YqjF (DUF2071 family)